jgi:hypothetical protein
MTGTITGFNTTGRSQIQLDRGRRVELSNSTIISESKKLDAVGKEDADVDNDGDSDESDEYLMKRRKAIKKAMKNEGSCGSSGKKKTYKEEDCPCCDGECKCNDNCPNCDCGDDD